MIKNLIQIIFFCVLSTQLVADEINLDKDIKDKRLSIFLRRYSTFVDSFEQNMLFQNFKYYDQDDKKTIPGYEIGFRKKIENSKVAFETEFIEYKKGNLGMRSPTCFGRYCDLLPVSSGTYLRNQLRSNILFDLMPEKLRFSFGARYIKSELSDSGGVRFNYTLGQKFIGPEIGIELQTDKVQNFNLVAHYQLFYLFGKIENRYSGSTFNLSPISYYSDPNAIYFGNEFGLKINYFIDETYYFSLGYSNLLANTHIKSQSMTVNYFADPQYKYDLDLRTNFDYKYFDANTSKELFKSIYLEAGIKL